MEEIPILGVVIGKGQVQIEQDKIKVVKEQKMPIKIKEVESFLEFANFYRRFIQNFSHTAKPLNELKEKKEQAWTDEHQWAFEELKEKITSELVLSLSKREGKFRVETDASGIHQDNQAKDDNDEYFLRRNYKNLLEQNMENTWSTKEDSK